MKDEIIKGVQIKTVSIVEAEDGMGKKYRNAENRTKVSVFSIQSHDISGQHRALFI
jgi:hypothetical protein